MIFVAFSDAVSLSDGGPRYHIGTLGGLPSLLGDGVSDVFLHWAAGRRGELRDPGAADHCHSDLRIEYTSESRQPSRMSTFKPKIKWCPRQDTSQNCSHLGRLAIAADLTIGDRLA